MRLVKAATKGEAKPEKAKADKHLRLKWKGNGSIYDAVSNGRGPIAGRYSVVTNRSAYRAVYVAAADQIEEIQDACSVKTAKALCQEHHERRIGSAVLEWTSAPEPEFDGMHYWNADGRNGAVFWTGQSPFIRGQFTVLYADDGDFRSARPVEPDAPIMTLDVAKACAAQCAPEF